MHVNIKSNADIKNSGLVPEHANLISEISNNNDTFILFRPVNGSLIQYGYATKDFHIKPKSSDWGPQTGFVCSDSNLSKRYGDPIGIEENKNKIEHTFKYNEALTVPLLLNRERIQELISLDKIQCQNHTGIDFIFPDNQYIGKRTKQKTEEIIKDYIFTFLPITESTLKEEFNSINIQPGYEKYETQLFRTLTAKNRALFSIQYEKIKSSDEKRYLSFYQKADINNKIEVDKLSPIEVFAKLSEEAKQIDEFSPKKLSDLSAKNEGDFLPFTSDYDLFLIAPNIRKYTKYYHEILAKKIKKYTSSEVKKTLLNIKFRAAVKTIIKSTGAKERKKIDKNLGKMSEFSIVIKDLINSEIKKKCNYKAGNVIHHAAEVDNLNGVNLDFPITIFSPFKRIINITNKVELQVCLSEIKLLNYAVYVNILWKDENYAEAINAIQLRLREKNDAESKKYYANLIARPLADFDLNYAKNRKYFSSKNILIFFQDEYEKLSFSEQRNIRQIVSELNTNE